MHIPRCSRFFLVGLIAWLLAAMAPGLAWGQRLPGRGNTLPQSPPPGPLADCSLYLYWDQFDRKVADTVKSIGQSIAGSPELSQAAASRGRVDVTATLYRENLLQSTPGCTKPVVRAYLENDGVLLVIESLHVTLCEMLVNSHETRAFQISVLQTQTGRGECGRNINPIPGMMTLGPLTTANRMLPGWNTVSLYLRGPFAAPARTVQAPVMPQACPALPNQPDRDIEEMITRNQYVTTDFPASYPAPTCRQLYGGSSSSMGVCTTKMWEAYHERLYTEFQAVLRRAQNSNDPLRVLSAAWWVIDKSNPSMNTIRSFDYKGAECDAIRNRFVIGCSIGAFDELTMDIRNNPAAQSLLTMFDPDDAMDELRMLATVAAANQQRAPARLALKARSAGNLLKMCIDNYGDANRLIDWMSQPLPFPDYRLDFLSRIKSDVQRAMVGMGYSNCPYYGDAVLRIDRQRWKFEYDGGMAHTLPVDWAHDFKLSAVKCLSGN